MIHNIIPRYEPQKSEPIHPPMIHVDKPVKWEYKQIVRDVEKEKLLDEVELNALGAQGWEMTRVVQLSSSVSYYFKRLSEK